MKTSGRQEIKIKAETYERLEVEQRYSKRILDLKNLKGKHISSRTDFYKTEQAYINKIMKIMGNATDIDTIKVIIEHCITQINLKTLLKGASNLLKLAQEESRNSE